MRTRSGCIPPGTLPDGGGELDVEGGPYMAAGGPPPNPGGGPGWNPGPGPPLAFGPPLGGNGGGGPGWRWRCERLTTDSPNNTYLQSQAGALSWPVGVLREIHLAKREVHLEVHPGVPCRAAACQEGIPGQAGRAAELENDCKSGQQIR
jgi:hypothetical protein